MLRSFVVCSSCSFRSKKNLRLFVFVAVNPIISERALTVPQFSSYRGEWRSDPWLYLCGKHVFSFSVCNNTRQDFCNINLKMWKEMWKEKMYILWRGCEQKLIKWGTVFNLQDSQCYICIFQYEWMSGCGVRYHRVWGLKDWPLFMWSNSDRWAGPPWHMTDINDPQLGTS